MSHWSSTCCRDCPGSRQEVSPVLESSRRISPLESVRQETPKGKGHEKASFVVRGRGDVAGLGPSFGYRRGGVRSSPGSTTADRVERLRQRDQHAHDRTAGRSEARRPGRTGISPATRKDASSETAPRADQPVRHDDRASAAHKSARAIVRAFLRSLLCTINLCRPVSGALELPRRNQG